MEDLEFSTVADETLQMIAENIEEADTEFKLDIDLIDSVLTIETENDEQFVINKHCASEQIWLSSPLSGASHFSLEVDHDTWIDSESNDLLEVLQNEMKEIADIDLAF